MDRRAQRILSRVWPMLLVGSLLGSLVARTTDAEPRSAVPAPPLATSLPATPTATPTATTAAASQPAPGPWQVAPGRSAVRATSGMVASSQPLASRVGIEVLSRGGNAVDAAIAMAAVLAVVEPGMSGLGGDALALVYLAKRGEVKALNATGRAPKAMTRAYFADKGTSKIPLTGWDSVTVPGAVAGWAALRDAYGTRPLGELLAPAIAYAEQGFAVMEKSAADWAAFASKLQADETARTTLLIQGRAPLPGEILKQPLLAKTLRTLAAGGRDAFYKGAIAQAIAAHSHAHGGLLTLSDLAEYQAEWVTPLSTTYRDHRIFEAPPNSQGLTALLALNILEGFDLKKLSEQPDAYYHTLIEATKLAFADRDRYLGDPSASAIPVAQLLSKEYAAQRRKLIDKDRAQPTFAPGALGPGDTSYVVVVDKDRNVVSYIGSLYMMLGSGVVAGQTGILLQDRAASFSLDPKHPNCVQPRKRPAHTIMPALLTKDGKPVMALGVVGGDMQPQAQVQVLSAVLDLGLPLQTALEAPRYLFQGGGEVVFEESVPAPVVERLVARGHVAAKPKPPLTVRAAVGGVQAVRIDLEQHTLEGASDPRKDGQALGY